MTLCRSRAARLAAALLIAPVALAPVLATPAFAITVFDPSNYAQNVLTAARSLQQITNQITSLQNEAQMLINQARNPASLPISSLQQIQQAVQKTQSLLQQAQNIAYDVKQIDQVPDDAIIVRHNWLRAYEFTTQAGAVALNDYARANDPFTKVGKTRSAVDVSSVIRASPDSFRVAWVQRTYQDGSLASTERWSAIITVVVQTPRDAEKLRANPLGIYVNAINWSKELAQ